MLQDSLSITSAIPPRLRRDKQFVPCAIENDHEFFANGIFEFNITRILEFLDADGVKYPVESFTVSSIPDLGGERLDEATVRSADLNRPVLLAEISPDRFNVIDGHHRIARARREGVLSIPARRIRCPDHLAFLTSARAYECYVEYWNGKVKEMEPRRRSTNNLLCWICGERPADSAEHKVKASDIRSICSHCNNAGTQVYDEAWRRLSSYLHANWRDITSRGSFDLSKVFGAETAKQAIRVQLYFVKAFGCKLLEENIRVDLGSFSEALMTGTAHPEVTLLVTSSLVPAGQMLSYESDVSVLRNGDEVYSAVWMNLVHPVGIKICYLKAGAPVREPPGFPWHPTRQRKLVKLSPYKGDTEPLVARRDLRI